MTADRRERIRAARRRLAEHGPPRTRPLPGDFARVALPRLLGEGVTVDAAFVDGIHRFHEVFVDLYYLRKLVRPGGLIVLDDFDKPPVRAAIRYFEGNLGWSALPGVAGPRLRALRLPDTLTEPPFEEFHPF